MINDYEFGKGFIASIENIIDQLLMHNFIERDMFIFTEFVKEALKINDFKKALFTVLCDRLIFSTEIVSSTDQKPLAAYIKFIKLLLSINNDELTNALETYLTKDKNPMYFLIMLEERVKKNHDISGSEKHFLHMMEIHRYNIPVVENFLNIIQQDNKYLIRALMRERSLFPTLKKYIKELGAVNLAEIKESVLPVIINNYQAEAETERYLSVELYLDIINSIMELTAFSDMDDTACIIFDNNYFIQEKFEEYVLNHTLGVGHIASIKNYCNYLSNKNIFKFGEFEKKFINKANGLELYLYAIQVSASNKRKVLQRLVTMGDEENLVKFIKNFSNYRILLPML